tara:strand:- start:370 stop:981 length:612 start_codon:yes stop_codon:yes gene_type:complete
MNNVQIKIVLIGDTDVGKTSIVNSFIYNNYKKTTDCTIGASFVSKNIKMKYCKDIFQIHDDDNLNKSELNISIHIWDTAGQERYKSLVPMYYRNSDILFYVNDITKEKLKYEIDSNILSALRDNCTKVIIFNKMDLPNNYIHKESNKDYIYHKVSAKNGININELFYNSIRNHLKKNLKYMLENNKEDNIYLSENKNKSTCCY